MPTRLRSIFHFAFAVILIGGGFLSPSSFADSCSTEMENTLKRITSNSFEVDRNLSTYLDTNFKSFNLRDKIADLTPNETWIDMGAGQGNAILDFIKTSRYRGKVVGVTFATPANLEAIQRFELKSGGRIKLLKGRLIENIPTHELPKAKIITDVYGPFSYGVHADEILQKYMDLLDSGGSVYCSFTPENNLVQAADGTYTPSLMKWLDSIDGLGVVADASGKNIRITKLQENVKIPKLEFQSMRDGMPPERKYIRVKKSWMNKILGR